MKMKIILLLLTSSIFIVGCAANEMIENSEGGYTIYGEVTDTFTYEQEYLTIEGDFTHIGVNNHILILSVYNAEMVNESGETIKLDDVNVGNRVEAFTQVINLDEAGSILVVERVIIMD
ncbi:hypothetical protein QA612_07940 [Evansella sp. AB-P1]|uniref:hypothetical protein n=1 Tax=Evansella sp. AB-P1 TaxID=3037653 RepID=UPI00241D1FC1|nr:hypothetical protein [Evansella sp. AB-P1]MDG5787423.1 hypothetical protein [Evansella sp. AB-P1]